MDQTFGFDWDFAFDITQCKINKKRENVEKYSLIQRRSKAELIDGSNYYTWSFALGAYTPQFIIGALNENALAMTV